MWYECSGHSLQVEVMVAQGRLQLVHLQVELLNSRVFARHVAARRGRRGTTCSDHGCVLTVRRSQLAPRSPLGHLCSSPAASRVALRAFAAAPRSNAPNASDAHDAFPATPASGFRGTSVNI
ncbi:unnamed protein product [Colias eurytheme]|nr:unnamed protein product [Colias eurytheme]